MYLFACSIYGRSLKIQALTRRQYLCIYHYNLVFIQRTLVSARRHSDSCGLSGRSRESDRDETENCSQHASVITWRRFIGALFYAVYILLRRFFLNRYFRLKIVNWKLSCPPKKFIYRWYGMIVKIVSLLNVVYSSHYLLFVLTPPDALTAFDRTCTSHWSSIESMLRRARKHATIKVFFSTRLKSLN